MKLIIILFSLILFCTVSTSNSQTVSSGNTDTLSREQRLNQGLVIGNRYFDAYLIALEQIKTEQKRTETAFGLYGEEKEKNRKLSESFAQVSQRLVEALDNSGHSEWITWVMTGLGIITSASVTYLIMK